MKNCSQGIFRELDSRGFSQRMSKNAGKPSQGRILFATFSCRLIKSRSYEETYRLCGTAAEFVGNKVWLVGIVGLGWMVVLPCRNLGTGGGERHTAGSYAGTSCVGGRVVADAASYFCGPSRTFAGLVAGRLSFVRTGGKACLSGLSAATERVASIGTPLFHKPFSLVSGRLFHVGGVVSFPLWSPCWGRFTNYVARYRKAERSFPGTGTLVGRPLDAAAGTAGP